MAFYWNPENFNKFQKGVVQFFSRGHSKKKFWKKILNFSNVCFIFYIKQYFMTQEKFISKVKAIYGDRYDLSKVVYKGAKNEVILVDKCAK